MTFAMFQSVLSRVAPSLSAFSLRFAPLISGLRAQALRLAAGLALAAPLLAALPLPAQTAHFTEAVRTLGSGFDFLIGVAVDGSGNVFVADNGSGAVKEIVAVNGSIPANPTINTLGSGFSDPEGVAVDGSGNVFVTDNYNAVKEIVAVNGSIPASPTIRILASGFSSPIGVAVDGSGNVFVADDGNGAVKEIVAVNGSIPASPTIRTLISGVGNPSGVAVDGNGNVFFTAKLAVNEIVAVDGSIPASPTIRTLAGGFGYPAGVVVDGSGDVFVVDNGNSVVKEIVAVDGSIPASPTIRTLAGGFSYPAGVAVDAAGNVFVTSYPAAVKEIVAGANIGSVEVGSLSANPLPLWFTFDTGGTLGSTAMLMQGVAELDFGKPGGTCTAGSAYLAGDVCTLNVVLRPRAPGPRYGAAELLDSSGNLIATAYVQGTGVGPLVNFADTASGILVPSAHSTLGSGFGDPLGLAQDGAGNVFVADASSNAVKEIMAAGGYATVNTLGSGFSQPRDVAVDGAGNVFVADAGNNAVKEIMAAGGYTTVDTLARGFSQPSGVAVDGSGNVFVADRYHVKEMVAAGGYAVINTLGSGFVQPTGVAVDGSGDVFVADTGNDAVKEMVAVNGSIPASPAIDTLGSGFSQPTGVAVDAAGNLFVADAGNRAVKEMVAVNGSIPASPAIDALASDFSYPWRVAVDGHGNVFVADAGFKLIEKLDYADPPELGFAPTPVGSQSSDSPRTVTVTNNGNADLAFPLPATGNNPNMAAGFTLDGATTCADLNASDSAAGTLAPGASCDYAVDFIPASGAANAGPLILTDNNLNAASPTYVAQNIHLWGSALGAPPFGSINRAVDSGNASTTVGQSDSLIVVGWVADQLDGAPLSNVKVYIDGNLAGTPTLGIARPDVAAALSSSAYLDSGYQLLYPASSLSPGAHGLTVVAIDSAGRSTTLGPVSFTVAAAAGAGQPFGNLYEAVDRVTGSTTVSRSDTLKVDGWVADATDGAPLSRVTVYIDGTSLGTPVLGIARPDVAAREHSNAFLDSGYAMLYPASLLAIGPHVVRVVATDSRGSWTTFGPLSFTVQ